MIVVEGGLIFCGNNHCLLEGVKCRGENCPMWDNKKQEEENLAISAGKIVKKIREKIEACKKEYEDYCERAELEKKLKNENAYDYYVRIRNEKYSQVYILEKLLMEIYDENQKDEIFLKYFSL